MKFVPFCLAAAITAQDTPLHVREAVRSSCGWRQAQDDRSVLGDPLQIAQLHADLGIGTHAPAEMVFACKPEHRWFATWFGVTTERGENGSVVLTVSGDGEHLFTSRVRRGGDEPLWVVVPITNVRELRVVVSDGGDGNGSDHANLLFPRLGVAVQEPRPVLPPVTTFVGEAAGSTERMALWSRQPARSFVEAYALGDGRIGAAWFGGVGKDRLVLNEISMWSGSAQHADRPDAAKNLPTIIDLLRAGKNVQAESLVNETFTCQGAGSGGGNGKDVPFGCYQTLGDLEIVVFDKDGEPLAGEVHDYVRWSFGEGHVAFRDRHGRQHERRLRCGNGIQMQWTIDGEPMDLRVTLRRRERATTTIDGGNTLVLRGALADGNGGDGVQFVATAKVLANGGSVMAEGNSLRVRAKTVWIEIAASTDFAGLGKTPVERSQRTPPTAPTPFAARLAFARTEPDSDRVTPAPLLDFGGHERRQQPTLDRMIAVARGGNDPDLFATYFELAATLLASSSVPGGLPANLQGLWAPEYQTPWNGDYHLNVNVQMNYWPALLMGRAAQHLPLVDLIESLVPSGTKTAKAYYAAPGWVAHTITNVWGYTSPGEHASWGSSNTCSGWLCRHLHEHWAFTQDRAFLQRVYPTLREAARFYRHILVDDGKHGWLVTPVSNSPENAFRMADGQVASVCMGPTIDQQIVRELFANVVEAAGVLGVDAELAKDLTAAAAKLAPHQIGKHGQLQEWLVDYEEPEPHHRHVSHLYGLYPGDQITPFGTPELARAARVTLARRGDDGTGWSLAFKANLWARLGDGDRALAVLTKLLRPVGVPGFEGGHGGSYPNLFCAHPPFQIDGNFGGAAAIGEMLLQSHRERPGEDFTVHLLPALPKAWSAGTARALRARGNVLVQELVWSDGRLLRASLVNANAEPRLLRVRTKAAVRVRAAMEDVVTTTSAPGVITFTVPARATVVLARID